MKCFVNIFGIIEMCFFCLFRCFVWVYPNAMRVCDISVEYAAFSAVPAADLRRVLVGDVAFFVEPGLALRVSQKTKKKYPKGIDILHLIWYNKDTMKRRYEK